MRFFLDTEFLENGPDQPVRLVSVGLVAENGQTYYAELNDVDLALANDWVKANVIPHLKGGADLKPRKQVAEELVAFIGEEPPEFWMFCGGYDWVVFCQIFGTMMGLPKGIPHFFNELRQSMRELAVGNIQLPPQLGAAHNALNDAQWNKDVYDFLKAVRSGFGTTP